MKKKIAWLLLAMFAFLTLAMATSPVVSADPGDVVNPALPKP